MCRGGTGAKSVGQNLPSSSFSTWLESPLATLTVSGPSSRSACRIVAMAWVGQSGEGAIGSAP